MPRLVKNVISVLGTSPLLRAGWDPRHIYRSMLPFLPPSSPILVHYNNLSDIKVLQVCSQNNKSQRGNSPISAITCTALSGDGHQVALGFDDGVVEVVDVELGTTISRSDGLPKPPVWLLFINRGVATETSEGDVYTLDNFSSHRQQIASRIDGSTMAFASLSHDGSMIVRAAQHSTKEWYKNQNLYIIHITTDSPTIHSLSIPSHIIPDLSARRRFPLQRSVGFSPDGQYVAAFDTQQAFVWSSISFQLIAHYSIEDPRNWFLNTNRPSTIPTVALPNDVVITPFPEHSGSIDLTSCVLFNLRTRLADLDSVRMRALSLVAAAAPVLGLFGRVWFRGCNIMIIPDSWNSKWRSVEPEPLFDPFWESPQNFSFPTSKDGTRFLLYDNEGFPVLVDISRLISGDCAV